MVLESKPADSKQETTHLRPYPVRMGYSKIAHWLQFSFLFHFVFHWPKWVSPWYYTNKTSTPPRRANPSHIDFINNKRRIGHKILKYELQSHANAHEVKGAESPFYFILSKIILHLKSKRTLQYIYTHTHKKIKKRKVHEPYAKTPHNQKKKKPRQFRKSNTNKRIRTILPIRV